MPFSSMIRLSASISPGSFTKGSPPKQRANTNSAWQGTLVAPKRRTNLE